MSANLARFEPDLLHKPRERIDAVQAAHFGATMDLVCATHPHYRAVLASRGLARADFRTVDDLARLPLVTKQDYMAAPETFLLGATDVPPEMRVVWDTMYTTGTSSGKPTPFVSTAFDYYRIIALYQRILAMRGVGGDDVIANLCPLTVYPHGAYHRVMAAGAALKIPVVNLVPGRPSPHFDLGASLDEVVAGIERTRATVLWGVASYVRTVLLRAAERQADFSRVRLAYVTGEPVSAGLRADFASRLAAAGAPDATLHVSYGLTEIQGGFPECAPGSGFHNPLPEDIHVSVVDPDTQQPLPDGERGLVVVSHLNRRGTLLLRYATGDLSILSRAACPHCGRTTDRFVEPPRRADELVKVKGMLVNPAVLEDALLGTPGVADYQAIIERERPDDPYSMDRLRVRLALKAGEGAAQTLAAAAESVKRAIGVTPVVEPVDSGVLAGADGALKLKRLIDQRGG